MKKMILVSFVIAAGVMTACRTSEEPFTDNSDNVTAQSKSDYQLEVTPDDLGIIYYTADTAIVSVNCDAVTVDEILIDAYYRVEVETDCDEVEVKRTAITVGETLNSDNQEYSNEYVALKIEGRSLLVMTPKLLNDEGIRRYSFIVKMSANGSSATLKGNKLSSEYIGPVNVPDVLIEPSSMNFPASGGKQTATNKYPWVGFYEIVVDGRSYNRENNSRLFQELSKNGCQNFDWLTIQVQNKNDVVVTLDENTGETQREFKIVIMSANLFWTLDGTQDGQMSSLPEIHI